jgi:hypothetical protein
MKPTSITEEPLKCGCCGVIGFNDEFWDDRCILCALKDQIKRSKILEKSLINAKGWILANASKSAHSIIDSINKALL